MKKIAIIVNDNNFIYKIKNNQLQKEVFFFVLKEEDSDEN